MACESPLNWGHCKTHTRTLKATIKSLLAITTLYYATNIHFPPLTASAGNLGSLLVYLAAAVATGNLSSTDPPNDIENSLESLSLSLSILFAG